MMIEFVLLLIACVYMCQSVCARVHECVSVCVCVTYKSVFVMDAVFLNHSFFNSCWLV